MLQTAEGGLQAVTDSLQRMRELAVQAASDSIGSTERGYLNTEFTQLITEIDRIVNSSTYNSVQLLDGTNGAMTFQVGANNSSTNDRISVTIADSNTAVLGTTQTTATLTGAQITGSITSGQVTINGTNIGDVSATGTTNFAANVKAAIEAADPAVTATVGASTFSMGSFTTIATKAASADTYQLAIEGVNLYVDSDGNAAAHSLNTSGGSSITAINFDATLASRATALAAAGVTYTGTASSGDLVFTKADGSNLEIVQTLTDAGTSAWTNEGFASLRGASGAVAEGGATFTKYGKLTLTSSADITVDGTSHETAGFHEGNRTDTASGGTAVSGLTVSSTVNAQNAISSLDNALSTVNSTRASIGSYQSAFETMISNLSVESENASSARSRILDADFAQESAALAKTQVLQQAGISVLAQANAMPQQVLALLQ